MALMSVLTVFFSSPPHSLYLESETNSPPGEDILTQPFPMCDSYGYQACVSNFQ